MDIFPHYKIRTRWLTWLLSVELVVSDSKEPDKKTTMLESSIVNIHA